MKKILCFIMCVAMLVTAFGGAVSALAEEIELSTAVCYVVETNGSYKYYDYFSNLQDGYTSGDYALADAQGQTVVLLTDISMQPSAKPYDLTVPDGVTIVGQGHTITSNGNLTADGTDFTLKNVKYKLMTAQGSFLAVKNGGTVNAEQCTFTASVATKYGYFYLNGGSMNFNGGSVEIAKGTSQLSDNSCLFFSNTNGDSVTLNNFTADISESPDYMGIYLNQGGTVTLTGSTTLKSGDSVIAGKNRDISVSINGNSVSVSDNTVNYSVPIMVKGASIRTSEPSGLRFSATIPASTTATVYGMLLAKYETIGNDEFTYEALTAAEKKCIAYDAIDGKSVVGNDIRFNMALKNIADYDVNYAARAYAEYESVYEKYSITVKAYSDFTNENVRSVAYVASEALGDLKESVTECDDGYDYKYLIDGKYSRYTKSEYDIIQKISLEKGDKPMWRFSEDASTGIVVRDVEINTGKGGDAVEIIQITDIHFNYCTEEDLKNSTLANTWENRAFQRVQKNNNGTYSNVESKYHSISNIESCLKYVNNENPDQLVVTGDIMDYLSAGNIELAKYYIFDPYPTVMACLGNHEPLQKMQGTVEESVSFEDRMAALSDAWPHDMYYTSKVIDEKVMAVVMDNGSANDSANDYGAFTAEQVTKLSADLALAREKGYTVLLFYHIPLATENAAYKNTHAVSYNGKGDANTKIWDYETKGINSTYDGATGDMYKLITSNGDIIAATFCGHKHNDYYTEINATDPDGIKTTIPQYILIGTFYGSGNALRITVN